MEFLGGILFVAIAVSVVALWTSAFAAANFTARHALGYCKRQGAPDLVSRSVAAAVAIVVVGICMTIGMGILLSLLSLLPP